MTTSRSDGRSVDAIEVGLDAERQVLHEDLCVRPVVAELTRTIEIGEPVGLAFDRGDTIAILLLGQVPSFSTIMM